MSRQVNEFINESSHLSKIKRNQLLYFNRITKTIIYIDDNHILSLLQEAAKNVYNITKHGDIKRFTSHSIRVGACVFLHSQNISTKDIKFV